MKIFPALALTMAFFATSVSQAKYCDDKTDLVYYGYRYYNPNIGRWLNRDPIHEVGFLTRKAKKLGWHEKGRIKPV